MLILTRFQDITHTKTCSIIKKKIKHYEYNFELIYKSINIIKYFEQNVWFELKSFEHY